MKRILLAPDGSAGGGSTAAPAAPAAPAAAPAPKSPAPSSTPAPAAKPDGSSAPSATPAPSAPEPPSSDDPFQRPKKAAAAAPSKPAAPAAKTEDFDRMAPKELRDRVKQLREENASYPSKIKALEDKIAQMESRGQDTTALTSRLTALEKERDDMAGQLRAVRQEASPEFKQKYDEPFNAMAARVKAKVSTFNITNAETGEVRKANWQDFTAIYGMEDGPALEKATEVFGNAASYIMGLREKLQDLQAQKDEALTKERTEFKQRAEAEQADAVKSREWMATTWRNENQRLATSNPDYMIDPTDTELLEAQKHALSTFDQRPKATDKDSAAKVILFDAHVRQKVGIVPVLQLRLERQNAEIKSLKDMIEELKGTAGGGARRQSGEGATPDESDEAWASAARKAVNSAG